MPTFNDQLVVDLVGDFGNPNPTIKEPSLFVKHSENGRSPAVTFMNDGGGHIVQLFAFANNAGLPNNTAASLYADWHGLTISGQYGMVFSLGPLANAPGVQEGQFTFANADLAAQGLNISGDASIDGNVNVGKDINVQGDVTLSNADCAEEFDANSAEVIIPGMVVSIAEDEKVRPSARPYDKCVVGVVSGAGAYKPALILDHRRTGAVRVPVGVLGKVYCWADALNGEIKTGDMLTSSATPGHAMRLSDSELGFGATIGKAMRGLKEGRGLIPVLLSLR